MTKKLTSKGYLHALLNYPIEYPIPEDILKQIRAAPVGSKVDIDTGIIEVTTDLKKRVNVALNTHDTYI